MNYVIGDVHGQYNCLISLINQLKDIDNIYFVGDLIDRGSKSKEVVELIIKNNNYFSILGNHEDMMLEEIEEILIDIENKEEFYGSRWLGNGGEETLYSYGLLSKTYKGNREYIYNEKNIELLKIHIEYIKKNFKLFLELTVNNQKIIISHGELNKYIYSLKDTHPESFKEKCLWNRHSGLPIKDIFNIFGHTPCDVGKTNNNNNNNICIDSGACYSRSYYGKMTAYCLETKEIIQEFNSFDD